MISQSGEFLRILYCADALNFGNKEFALIAENYNAKSYVVIIMDQQYQIEIQVIPTGKITLTDPNRRFSVAVQARKEALKYEREINKTLPLPRNRK